MSLQIKKVSWPYTILVLARNTMGSTLGYEKCYWMIYKSMQNFVKHLKKEDEEEQQEEQKKKKPRLIKLPDPTVFTISSPSAWQKRNLSSPEIFSVELCFQGIDKDIE